MKTEGVIAVEDSDERSTTHVMRSVRNTERVYKNAQAKKVQETEAKHPGDFSKIHPYVKGELYRQSFQETGDTQSSVWSCGQSIGLIDDVVSCQQRVATIVADAAAIIRQRLPAKLADAQRSKL